MKALSPLVAFPRSNQDIDFDRAIAFHDGTSEDLNYVLHSDAQELKRWYGLHLLMIGDYEGGIDVMEHVEAQSIPLIDNDIHRIYVMLLKLENEYRKGNLIDSIPLALDLLRLLKDFPDKKSINFQAVGATLFYDFAYYHNKTEACELAEKDLTKAQKLFEKLAKKDESRFGEALLSAVAATTVIYKSRIKKQNVLAHYQAATTALISALPDDSNVLDELISNLTKEGELLAEMGNYKESIKYYTKALNYLRKKETELNSLQLELSLKLGKSLIHINKKEDKGYEFLQNLRTLATKLNAEAQIKEIDAMLDERPKNEFLNDLKRMFCIIVVFTMACTVNAQLVMGHRGSIWGVENTRTSFINGVNRGFDGLECDIKVTQDGRFVISHDDKIGRLNPDTIDVTKHGLDYLLKVPLSQTRKGIYYEGTLCSLEEYLDICKKFNKIPLIEIKWCSNIYSNNSNPAQYNYDGIPALMETIAYKGLADKAILLTSMRGVLKEIRSKYPNAQLQCLVNDKWEHLVDYCVENNIDIDVRNDANTDNLVQTFHDKGLKVNVWCVDNPDDFKKFSDLGVDFITSNCYTPAKQ